MLELSLTDLHLAELSGEVVRQPDGFVISRWTHQPTYRWGNALFMPRAPREGELRGLLARFDVSFEDPAIRHATLRWDDHLLPESVTAEARALGMVQDGGLAMRLDHVPDVPLPAGLTVRPIPLEDWALVEALNRRCDGSEHDGAPDVYLRFKEGQREQWWAWVHGGDATWWGAFLHGELVGQCGAVPTPWGVRLQSVETAPEHRRKGVCSALVAAVARHAIEDLRLEAVHLGAELDGPALSLYRRLGFKARGYQRMLVLTLDDPPRVRPERPTDHAGVASLVRAAFRDQGGGGAEVRLLEDLRDAPDSLSLVATHGGTVEAQALFTRLHVRHDGGSWPAMALGPIAVRPSRQGEGLGSLLVREGLAMLEARGDEVCFLVGDPAYYVRFGFVDAGALGFRARWPLPEGALQVRGGPPFPGPPGMVAYDDAFDDAT